MAKRISDTQALVEGVPDGAGSFSHSISSRKIANGFVVSRHEFNEATGASHHQETFHERAPRLVAGKVARGPSPDTENPLSSVKKYL